jgi:hypothetical protein
VETKKDTVAAGGSLKDAAVCPTGELPTGGGEAVVSALVAGTVTLVQSYPAAGEWVVDVENTATAAVDFVISAVCVNAS